MENCIFCDILSRKEPASRVFEDRHAAVILDLFPVTEGHALIISRHHSPQLSGLPASVSSHLLMLAEKVMQAQKALDPSIEAHNLLINDGKVANQHVPHVHLHVIPRRRGDRVRSLFNWSTRFLLRANLDKRRQRLDQLALRLSQQLED